MKPTVLKIALGIALLGLMAAPAALAGENGRQNRGRRQPVKASPEKKAKKKVEKKVEVVRVPARHRIPRPVTVVRHGPRRVLPTPRVVRRPRRVFVPGHYELRAMSVWVPGTVERVWERPVYREIRLGHGVIRFCVRSGGWREIRTPGHYETRQERVWVPGYWTYR